MHRISFETLANGAETRDTFNEIHAVEQMTNKQLKDPPHQQGLKGPLSQPGQLGRWDFFFVNLPRVERIG